MNQWWQRYKVTVPEGSLGKLTIDRYRRQGW